MAGRKTKLTDEVIEKICEYIKLRMKIKDIGKILDIHPDSIQRWVREGEHAKSGKKRELVDAIAKAKAELQADLSEQLIRTAFEGSTKIVTKDTLMPDGSIVPLKTITEIPPSAKVVMDLLALIAPAEWQKSQHIRIDHRKPLEDLGFDAEKVESAFLAYLEAHQSEIGTAQIVEIPEKTA